MKLTKELAFVAKHIEKGFIPTTVVIGNIKYFSVLNTVYSSELFTQEYTWDLIEKAFTYVDVKEGTLDKITNLIKSVETWDQIYLEDINTFDAVGNIAGIKDTGYGIGVSDLNNNMKLVQDKPYTIRVSKEGMIVFLNEKGIPLIIAGLYKMQTSLDLNNN